MAYLPTGANSGTLTRMSDSPRSGSLPRVDELDGLRGLLALWVALSHLLAWTGFWENPGPGRLDAGWLVFISAKPAVETFIILSGFAISFLLHKRKQSYGAFMRGRFFRIYPVYLLCLAVAIGTSFLVPFILDTATWRETVYFDWIGQFAQWEQEAFGAHVFWHLLLLNGVLTKGFLPGATGTLLLPAWSITLEWQYYLVSPLIARIVKTAAGLAVLGGLSWLGIHYSAHWQNTQLSFLLPQLPLFLIGIGSYHLYAKICAGGELRPLHTMVPVGLAVLSILADWYPVALTAWALGFGCIVARGNDPVGRALTVIRSGLLLSWPQFLGRISYPLYLVHWPVIILVLAGMLRVQPGIGQHAAFAVLTAIALPSIILSAWFVHRIVEKPMMAYGKRFDRKRAPQPGAMPEPTAGD